MRTASTRDLRNNFRQVAAWIAAGEEVEITSRGKTVARLVPPVPNVPWQPPSYETLVEQANAIWGNRVRTDEEIDEMLEYARDPDS